MKNLSLLGSTGSIGRQTLDIVRKFPDRFKIVGLGCNSNVELLREQIDKFNPEIVCVYDEAAADQLKTDVQVYKGMPGLLKLASLGNSDTVVNSLVGSIGVLPTVKAIENLKNVCLANKETLVTAGQIVMDKVKMHKTILLPIDSEHSAIWQCVKGYKMADVKKMTLTCSGGAFRDKSKEELANVKAADALLHPTWNMGAKITIDCATLMNKGFEVIEANHLYGTDYSKIDVVIHPQSIVHSFVEFSDNSVLAQLGEPDMRIPIQFALMFGERVTNESLPLLNMAGKMLSFYAPDVDRFPCLPMAYNCGVMGGNAPAVMNAANEVCVKYFLQDKIGFLDIPLIIREMIEKQAFVKRPNLDELMSVDQKVKDETERRIIG